MHKLVKTRANLRQSKCNDCSRRDVVAYTRDAQLKQRERNIDAIEEHERAKTWLEEPNCLVAGMMRIQAELEESLTWPRGDACFIFSRSFN